MHHSNTGTWRGSRILKIAAFAGAAGLLAGPVVASHSWGGYHWARTTAQISPPVGDNVTAAWDGYLRTAVADWNRSTVIESPLVAGQSAQKQCKPVAGRIEVCNATYGRNGWLGIASIWLTGGHISQGTTKVNDTYFNMAQYNNPAERASVMCQEIGHDYGLDHQDEDFSTDNTNSCMDYTNNPVGNEHPDRHDYDQLLAIYNHVDSAAAAGAAKSMPSQAAVGDSAADWGTPVRRNSRGQADVYVRDLGKGNKVITHVLWADER
ncbi:MAG TPA: hypothetical protein VF605_19400 [Allosphingosinicella sp.]|jgi:hypothetical protein